MKKLVLTSIALVSLTFSAYSGPKPTTVQTPGDYVGRTLEGKPICNPNDARVCVFQTYIHDDNFTFPNGIMSATYQDPDTGFDIPFSGVIQTMAVNGSYILDFAPGTGWSGPFGLVPGHYTIVP
jgi:hypothetical protein